MGHLKSSSSNNNNNNDDSPQKLKPRCLSRTTASSPSPSSDTNNINSTDANAKSPRNWWPPLPPLSLQPITLPNPNNIFRTLIAERNVAVLPQPTTADDFHNLDLQLSSSSPSPISKIPTPTKKDERLVPPTSTRLRLSIGGCDPGDDCEGQEKPSSRRDGLPSPEASATAAEKAYADEARRQARRQIEMAEKELADAKRMRKQAQAEMDKAVAIKERAREQIESLVLEITCNACKQRIQGKELAAASLAPEENSLVLSYLSSAVTEGEVDDHNGVQM
ncbi:hypothetical protein MLD38_028284 [Melastoma candidum]|nr:hypothetical protein MLD38_028284 [Melastoma candidum]